MRWRIRLKRITVEELNHIDFQNKRVIAMTAHRRENLGEPLDIFAAV